MPTPSSCRVPAWFRCCGPIGFLPLRLPQGVPNLAEKESPLPVRKFIVVSLPVTGASQRKLKSTERVGVGGVGDGGGEGEGSGEGGEMEKSSRGHLSQEGFTLAKIPP
ncbi:hypothetical protein EYF80_014971 [Liparis tanakae]|uniref:Uncharacterized protein n=1 Tax=Liparis tanakae TaxID=230148 RepID=A0A4Z2IAT7_9TELE|nr:hypothetical protein EYF80_014971 [Liparis tanakae]